MGILKEEKDNNDTFFTGMDALFLENLKFTPFQQQIIQK